MSGHHCPSCTCDPGLDTIFTKYDKNEDKRDASMFGKCSNCKNPLVSGRQGDSVTVRYSTGSKRYYCQTCASDLLGWKGEYTSTTAERLIIAAAQLDAGVIDHEEYGRILDSVT